MKCIKILLIFVFLSSCSGKSQYKYHGYHGAFASKEKNNGIK